jgi:antitoxin YefM
MAMTAAEQMSLADVKNRLPEVVDLLEREHGRVVITKHGHPAAVVISVEDLESLEETPDVMGREALLAEIREALAELARYDRRTGAEQGRSAAPDHGPLTEGGFAIAWMAAGRRALARLPEKGRRGSGGVSVRFPGCQPAPGRQAAQAWA